MRNRPGRQEKVRTKATATAYTTGQTCGPTTQAGKQVRTKATATAIAYTTGQTCGPGRQVNKSGQKAPATAHHRLARQADRPGRQGRETDKPGQHEANLLH